MTNRNECDRMDNPLLKGKLTYKLFKKRRK